MASNNPRKRGPPSSNPQVHPPQQQQQQSHQQKFQGNQTHDRKRLKLQDARSIAVQSSEGALKAGHLDINAFIRSREFEIRALEEAMGNSKRANNKRAFQSVPRSMRRRTASHNVKKVPKRLRGRHAREMADDNTPTVTSRRRKPTSHMRLRAETAKRLQRLSQKKSKVSSEINAANGKVPRDQMAIENALRPPPAVVSKFRKRQVRKTWLPTHIWHAKRAHMVARWRYAIAERPTEKCYRQTHRASTLRGAVAWDRSYYATILVKGRSVDVTRLLGEILSPDDVMSVCETGLVKRGRRSWDGWTYERGSFPMKPIAPTTILWARAPQNSTLPDSEATGSTEKSKSPTHRELFLRVHPSAFFQLWTSILESSRTYPSVTVEDLRFELGSIEVTGPAATDALLSVLQPRNDTPKQGSPEDTWKNLRSLTNPSSLPPGAFLGFDVIDPRLRFPPRATPLSQDEDESEISRLYTMLSTWPADTTQQAPSLFSREARAASLRAQVSQKQINNRKANAMPGEPIQSLPTDPFIPVILLASRYPSPLLTQSGKTFSAGSSNAIGSWTVLLPWKWVLPVWYSVMHYPGVRLGGINQGMQLCYENGVGSFPDDFPGTMAGYEEEARKAAERKEWWEKRPKQKRIAWESVDLGAGRKGELGRGECCDWDYLIGEISKHFKPAESCPNHLDSAHLPSHAPHPASSSKVVSTGSTLGDDSMEIDTSIPPAGQIPPPPQPLSSSLSTDASKSNQSSTLPWIIPSSILRSLLTHPHAPLPQTLTNLPKNSLHRALFNIRVTFLHRGSPSDRARIYRLPLSTDTSVSAVKCREAWLALLESHNIQKKRRGMSSSSSTAPGSHDIRQDKPQAKYQDLGASRFAKSQPQNAIILPPLQPGNDKYPVVPDEENLIGFITSGNFNLKEGKGTGVGAVAFMRVFPHFGEASEENQGKSKLKGKAEQNAISTLCVVRDVGNDVGRLARWEAI
ncbi:ribonucleases P/MRP protein subunit POP1-domain-containing protein [Peziza echinospora]|nr:ribonucleases P/MRP protein subunit POP1-domain-containing protein [Peziza echinospora]